MRIISVLKETKKKPVSERTNKEKMVQGSFGMTSVKCRSIIEIESRSVSIARYDNVKRYENNELAETADHSMFGNDSKLNERPPQRMCFEWSSEQNSSNKIWKNVLSIKKQKSGHQPLGIQKTKERTVLDSFSTMKSDDECLGSPVEGKAGSLCSKKLSKKVHLAVVLDKWIDRRCESCNARLTSFNLIKKRTRWCSKTCRALVHLQDKSSTTEKAVSMFAMSWCSSEEVLLSDKNIERGIPAEELMDEANMLEQVDSMLPAATDYILSWCGTKKMEISNISRVTLLLYY
ncbi:unnamed protein product [Brugia timori]|uniref:FCS-type domain-containing protein n=1 Tax=Brugia timori TaxID=42155 RepID=A0A0R3QJG5_9BILA|nr:unnamed protein product [Brugia timori]